MSGGKACSDGLEKAPAALFGIFALIKDDADLRDRWRQLGESDRRCLIDFCQS